jgi:hypothetical protein
MTDIDHSQGRLVSALNDLLVAVELPFTLMSPTDLIPSLLLAILERLTSSTLPISSTIRESRSPSSKVQAMKIFLGVLENDVLGIDVGLSELDPRKLAEGEWDEVVYVAELLVWLGRKLKVIDPEEEEGQVEEEREAEQSGLPARAYTGSPSTHSTVTNSAQTSLSMAESRTNHTDTSFTSESTTPAPIRRRPPRCIHEVEEPSFLIPSHSTSDSFLEGQSTELPTDTESYCDCSTEIPPATRDSPVRLSGWIGKVDQDLELSSFEASRPRRPTQIPKTPPPCSETTPVRYPSPFTPPFLLTNCICREALGIYKTLSLRNILRQRSIRLRFWMNERSCCESWRI